MNQISLKALAKINLGLDVVKRRDDGYHEVRMIMQTINLYDQIYMRKVYKPGITIKTNLFYLPINENNLVYKAAKMLMDEFEITQGIFLNLRKIIPVSAGMAGGSSDAAATLYGINKLFELGLTKEELMERGVRIGADVPYCLMRGTVLAEGIGEKLTPLPPMPRCGVLIAKPGISVSTKFVYEKLHANELEHHPDIDELMQGLENQDLHRIAHSMENVLETVTIKEYPIIEAIKMNMLSSGAIGAIMSGSGPTVFGLYDDERLLRKAYERMCRSNLAKQVFTATIYNNGGTKYE